MLKTFKLVLITILCCTLVFNNGMPAISSALNLEILESTNQVKSVWFPVELPYPYNTTHITIRDLEFFNHTLGWACAYSTEFGNHKDTLIFRTIDSGLTWKLQFINTSLYEQANRIDVVDEERVWVTSYNGLYYTNNSGENWHYDSTFSNNPTSGVYFFNSTLGWIGSGDIPLAMTVDGGLTWIKVTSWNITDLENSPPRNMVFYNKDIGWAITSKALLHTQDGGMSWEVQMKHGGWSLSLIDNQELWGVNDFLLAHTLDGGQTWVSEKWPQADDPLRYKPYFTDIEFINKNQGWVVGSEPHIAYTNDGGQTWDEQHINTELNPRIAAIDMYNETLGWASGTGGLLLRTTQGNYYNTTQPVSSTDQFSSWEVPIIESLLLPMILVILLRRKRRLPVACLD